LNESNKCDSAPKKALLFLSFIKVLSYFLKAKHPVVKKSLRRLLSRETIYN